MKFLKSCPIQRIGTGYCRVIMIGDIFLNLLQENHFHNPLRPLNALNDHTQFYLFLQIFETGVLPL